MIKGIFNRIVGTRFEREMKKLQPIVDEIFEHEERLATYSEEGLQAQTARFRGIIAERTGAIEERIAELRERRRHTEESSVREDLTGQIAGAEEELHDETEEVLAEILPEVFATVREACRRLVGTDIEVTGNRMTWDGESRFDFNSDGTAEDSLLHVDFVKTG